MVTERFESRKGWDLSVHESVGLASVSELRLRRLAELEAVIDDGIKAFVRVGRALATIRDEELYRPRYASFREYVSTRWSSAHAYRMIEATEVVAAAGRYADRIGNEAQARELKWLLSLPSGDAEEVVGRVLDGIRERGERQTAKNIRTAVMREMELPEDVDPREAQEVLDRYGTLRSKYGADISPTRMERAAANRAGRVQREREAMYRRQEIQDSPENLVEDIEIQNCDFRDLNVSPGSVRLIITDPPYSSSSLPLYTALGEFAARVLTDEGYLAVYTGSHHEIAFVNEVMKHIGWWWRLVVPMRERQVAHGKGWIVDHKPVHLFRKSTSPVRGRVLPSTITSTGASKEHHRWGQAEYEAEFLISNLTSPGELICDPFSGGGTTAVAALRTGRRCIASEIDRVAYSTSLRRLRER